jgi:hypothetical protein
MQRAMAFITALERGDEAAETIWAAAIEEDRAFMLAVALCTCARNPDMMANVLQGDKATRLVNLARATEMIAAMGDDTDDQEGDGE